MQSEASVLDHVASIQCDLKTIRDLYPDQWDSDRILNFARAIAVRSIQIQDGMAKAEAEAKVDAALARVVEHQFAASKPVAVDKIKSNTDWAMLCHCLNLMDGSALHQFSAKIGDWHKQLRSALTMLDEDAVHTLAFMLQGMISQGDLRDLSLIEELPPHQRSQVYGRLTLAQAAELGRLMLSIKTWLRRVDGPPGRLSGDANRTTGRRNATNSDHCETRKV